MSLVQVLAILYDSLMLNLELLAEFPLAAAPSSAFGAEIHHRTPLLVLHQNSQQRLPPNKLEFRHYLLYRTINQPLFDWTVIRAAHRAFVS